MKKYRRRNRLHGVQSSVEIPKVVRWLGAYGLNSDLVEMAKFELRPTRDVAAEALPPSGLPKIKHVSVGLLVDTSKTQLVRGYEGDAYTYVSSSKKSMMIAGRDQFFVEEWDQVASISTVTRTKSHGGKYVEVTMRNPVYLGVVVTDNKPGTKMVSELVAKEMKLPIFKLY